MNNLLKIKLTAVVLISSVLMACAADTNPERPLSEMPQPVAGRHPWTGKRVAYFGDSITDPDNDASTDKYWTFLSRWLGTESYVYAKSGRQWDNITQQAARLNREHGHEVDAILILCGTNDFNNDTPLGVWYEEKEETVVYGHGKPKAPTLRKHRTHSMDKRTFRGRINVALDSIRRTWPTQQIVLLTPIHRSNFHYTDTNWQIDESYANALGLYLSDYTAAVKEAADVWAVPVIDLGSVSGLLPSIEAHGRYFHNENDLLHPNDAGHERMALALYYQLAAIHVPQAPQGQAPQAPQGGM